MIYVSIFYYICYCSITKSCPTLCDPMDCRTPCLSILCHVQECAQPHAHWGGDAIQHSHPVSSPSPPAFNVSQHQVCLFVCLFFPMSCFFVSVVKVLELQPQHQCFQYSGLISFRTDWFDLLAVQGTLKSRLQNHGLKAQFFCVQPSLWSNSHICTWLLEKP